MRTIACPACGGPRVVNGRLTEYGGPATAVVFRPDGLRSLTLTVSGGADVNRSARACRDCGLVWSQVDPPKLERFLRRHCDGYEAKPAGGG